MEKCHKRCLYSATWLERVGICVWEENLWAALISRPSHERHFVRGVIIRKFSPIKTERAAKNQQHWTKIFGTKLSLADWQRRPASRPEDAIETNKQSRMGKDTFTCTPTSTWTHIQCVQVCRLHLYTKWNTTTGLIWWGMRGDTNLESLCWHYSLFSEKFSHIYLVNPHKHRNMSILHFFFSVHY